MVDISSGIAEEAILSIFNRKRRVPRFSEEQVWIIDQTLISCGHAGVVFGLDAVALIMLHAVQDGSIATLWSTTL